MSLSPYTVVVFSQDTGNVVPFASVGIYERNIDGSSGGYAQIYSDPDGVTPITQPGATANSRGTLQFYASADGYNVEYTVDDQTVIQPIDTGITEDYANNNLAKKPYSYISDALNDNNLELGNIIFIKARDELTLGGGFWEVVLSSSVTEYGENEMQSIVKPLLAISLLSACTGENTKDYEVFDANKSKPFGFESQYQTANAYGIAHTGQSLAEGGVGGDAVSGVGTAAYPDRALMFNPQPVGLSNDVLSNVPVSVVEPSRVTIAHSLTRNLAKDNSNTYLFSGQAWGGQAYSALKKGGSTGVYEKVTDQVSDAVSAFSGIEYIGVSVIHGEQDGINNNTTYAADLNEWQTDFNTDIKALTGQINDVTMFICQTSTAGGYGFNGGINETTFPTPLEQLEAHETYPNIVMVAPKYFLEYADHSHIKNISQRILGEYYAKAFKQGNSYEPLRPSTITPSGSSVIIDFVGNVGSLVFDTTLVNAVADNGFSYRDDSGNTITSVTITGENQVTVNLSGPVGLNAVVAYAYHNGAGGSSSQVAGNGDRGNLRDNDTVTSLYNGDPLYNWAVTFRKAVN